MTSAPSATPAASSAAPSAASTASPTTISVTKKELPIVILPESEHLSSKNGNWPTFKRKIRTIIQFRELLPIIDGEETEPSDPDGKREWKKKNGRALAQIELNLKSDVINDLPEGNACVRIWTRAFNFFFSPYNWCYYKTTARDGWYA